MIRLMKSLLFVAVTALPALVCSTHSLADDMAVPAGQQGAAFQSTPRPRSGLSMDQVSSKFGSPGQKVAPVGNPPITRWIYDQYTVYFENDRVIHSVLHPAQ